MRSVARQLKLFDDMFIRSETVHECDIQTDGQKCRSTTFCHHILLTPNYVYTKKLHVIYYCTIHLTKHLQNVNNISIIIVNINAVLQRHFIVHLMQFLVK